MSKKEGRKKKRKKRKKKKEKEFIPVPDRTSTRQIDICVKWRNGLVIVKGYKKSTKLNLREEKMDG